MIEPCEVCPNIDMFIDTQINSEEIIAELDEHKRSLWRRYFDLKQENPGEADLPISESVEIITRRAYAETQAPLIISSINHFTRSLRTQTEQVEFIDCGTTPITCPRLLALLVIYERVNEDIGILKAKSLDV